MTIKKKLLIFILKPGMFPRDTTLVVSSVQYDIIFMLYYKVCFADALDLTV